MLSLPFFSMMISERRVFFLQFIWYKIIFRPSSFEKKDQKYEIIWIVTVRMDVQTYVRQIGSARLECRSTKIRIHPDRNN